MIKLYQTTTGLLAEDESGGYRLQRLTIDQLFTTESPMDLLRSAMVRAARWRGRATLRAPVGQQEVWAAGVTYLRSRAARKAESRGSTCYDHVYEAERPEIFFKSAGWRVVGPTQPVRIRPDSSWNVPEPELVLTVSAAGRIFGYTIGNDMSARSIEGENPLYLPQAKIYDGACAIGPCLLITDEPLPTQTEIRLSIERKGRQQFVGHATLAQLKRTPASLVDFLYRAQQFPQGAFLFTGTGVIPPENFSLQRRDVVSITIPFIGTLTNPVA